MGCRVPLNADTGIFAVPKTPDAPELPLRFRSTFRAPTSRPDARPDVEPDVESIAEPESTSVDPTKVEVEPEPVTLEVEPVTLEVEPATFDVEPVTLEVEPTTDVEPVTREVEPATFEVDVDLEFATISIELATVDVESTTDAAAEPESAASEPEPEPAASEPEPEPAASEPEPASAPAPVAEPAVEHEPQAPAKRSGPRHRAERVRNRRTPGASFRRSVALGCVSAVMGVTAFGAIAASADGDRTGSTTASTVSANAADRATPTDTIAAVEPEVDEGPAVTGELSVSAAPFTGGTQVTVTGEDLDQVAAVTVGEAPATIVAVDDRQVTFAVPAVDDSALGSTAEVHFADAAGQPIDVEQQTAVVAAGTSVVQPLEGALTGRHVAKAPTAPRTLTLTYTNDPGIDAQVAYVLTYWSSYNSAQYPVIDGYDCANFASQSLIARGWSMDGGWYLDQGTGAMSASWSSSTALRDYLRTSARATELDDSQRDQVKVGDIAQFDWDDSGDRDHTAVVTRIEHTDDGTKVWVASHTKDVDYWDVDTALATGGGSVSYFSIR